MEEESREEGTLDVIKKKKKKQLSSEKAVTLSIKLGAVVIIVGLLALAIYFATGKKKDGKGLIDDSDIVQGFLDQLTETTDKKLLCLRKMLAEKGEKETLKFVRHCKDLPLAETGDKATP